MELKETVLKAFEQNRKAVLYTIGAGVAVLGLGLGYKYIRKPKKLTQVGVVSQLILHPLKSGKGLQVATAECLRMGLKYGELRDRHWLVTTEDGQMVTGRQEPRLVLVSMTAEGGDLCLNAPDMEELRVPLGQPNNNIINCRVFSADIQGRDCGDEVSRWLTRYLAAGKTFRMVHYEPEMKPRMSVKIESPFPADEEVAYPDTAAVMLLSEASVKDLSSRLDKDVTVSRFRPNIVVSDCEAFGEDSWDELQIGSVRIKRVMACGRCIFTTVDPETGIINRKEPLDTLKSYRQCDPSQKKIYKTSPLFGQYYIVKQTGILHVGEPIYKISY
ncbi:mitochondrial amidoxime-reducing component 1 [Clupea harengus]|uniref:Mitochondrial amidoxime-reducing component 1 n=1 Tax=Clupea harengus TaxID=7950 RepID=A0A6P8GB14_CLUHA|nr:mitochondrial amidoxime-reducing component 1 [Clupea harengus]